MNSEFHYHITCLIAARAGFPPEDARTIATASQYTDDNSIIFEIDKDRPTAYGNYISQTMNILKPKAKLFRIYPVFHFINNLTPVLVDCDPKTFCMDVAEVEEKITEKTAAIMPVHIYGHPVNMEEILKLATKHDLKVVEDAAEAHGAECLVDGKWLRCGSFGEVSAFSFYANKNITCGEGGMVLTDDDEFTEMLRNRRNLCFGHKERFLHEDRGWNFRMTNMQAAIGCAQLEKVDHFIERKLEMAARYNEGLRDLPVQTPHVETWARTSVWMYAIVLDDSVPFDATEFAKRLVDYGVQTRPFFLGMHEQPVYHKMGYFLDEKFPVTEKIAKRGLYLPSGQAITDEQIEHVCNAVHDVFK